MNFGRIILRNLMGSGYSKERMTIIRPGEKEIDGVKCVESLKALDGKLDLLIVAVAASAVYDLVDEIIETDAVESVMLIPGSLGETKRAGTRRGVGVRINAAHGKDGGGRFSRRQLPGRGLASGFLRLLVHSPRAAAEAAEETGKKFRHAEPERGLHDHPPESEPVARSALHAGAGQPDRPHPRRHAQLLFAERPEIETIGIYVEGFKDLDGLDFAKAVRKGGAEWQAGGGLQVGQDRSRAWAASWAIPRPSPAVRRCSNRWCARPARSWPRTSTSFDDLFYIAGALHRKKIHGKRLGAISGAGFRGGRHGRLHRVGQLLDGNGRPGTEARSSAWKRSWSRRSSMRWWKSETPSTSIPAPTTRPTCRSPRLSCRIPISTRSWSGSTRPRRRCGRWRRASCGPATISTTRRAPCT